MESDRFNEVARRLRRRMVYDRLLFALAPLLLGAGLGLLARTSSELSHFVADSHQHLARAPMVQTVIACDDDTVDDC